GSHLAALQTACLGAAREHRVLVAHPTLSRMFLGQQTVDGFSARGGVTGIGHASLGRGLAAAAGQNRALADGRMGAQSGILERLESRRKHFACRPPVSLLSGVTTDWGAAGVGAP